MAENKMAKINFDQNSKEYAAAFGVGKSDIQDNAPTGDVGSVYDGERYLIVGLGGQGVRTVAQIKRLAQKRFKKTDLSDGRVVFAALDTDSTMFPNSGLVENTETFPIPVDTNVLKEEYNYQNTEMIGKPRREFPASWINFYFSGGFLPNGAGQNRQQSKAIFHHNNRTNGVYTAIAIESFIRNRLAALIKTNQPIRVYLIAGIAGGTGSGSFIELAQMIKRAFEKEGQLNMHLEGFFYLPDVIEQFPDFQDVTNRNSMYANAYAALKELDYYYSAKQRIYGTDYLTVDSTGYAPLEVRNGKELFDTVRLVSGSNGMIIPNDKNAQALQTVSEAIINLIAVSNVATGLNKDNNQDYRQVESNLKTYRKNVLAQCYQSNGNEANDVCADDTFEYLSVGTASLSIHKNPIKMNMIAKTMRTLSGQPGGFSAQQGFVGFKNEPMKQTDADVAIDNLKLLTPDMVFAKLRELCKLNWKTQVDLANLCNTQNDQSNNLISTVEAITMEDDQGRKRIPYDEVYNLLTKALNTFFAAELKNTKSKLLAFMKENGPKALTLLYEGRGSQGLFATGHSIQSKIITYGTAHFREDEDKRKKYNAALANGNKMNQRWTDLGHQKTNARDELSKAVSELKQEDLADRAARHAEDTYRSDYLNKLTEYFAEIGGFAESLDALYRVYNNLGKEYEDSVKNKKTTQDENSTRQSILVDDVDLDWAEGIVEEQVTNNINFTNVKNAIIDSFDTDAQRWTAFDPNSPDDTPRAEMDRIMTEQKVADLGNQLTLTNLFENRMAKDPTGWRVWLNKLLVDTLIPKADPLYRKKDAGVAARTSKYLIVPETLKNVAQNGQAINNELVQICNQNGIALSYTTLDESITCYSTQYALPLYSLQELPVWEAAYEKMPHQNQHSNESKKGIFDPVAGVDWVDYPALCLQQNPRIPDRATGVVSREGQFFINTIDSLFDEMKELGLIECVQDPSGTYSCKCYLMTKPGWDWGNPNTFNFDRYAAYPGVTKDGFVQGGKTLVEYYIDLNKGSLNDTEVVVPIRFGDDQEAFTECSNPDMAEARAKRVVRRNVPLIRALKTTKTLYLPYAKEIEARNKTVRYDKVGGDMLWLVASGAIENIGGVWYLKDHAYAGEYIKILDTDPVAVAKDWRFQGDTKFEYLALRQAFVDQFGQDDLIRRRIQNASNYVQADDVADPHAKVTEKARRKKEYLDRLNNIFKNEAKAAEELKKPDKYQARQLLTLANGGKDVTLLLNDYTSGVTGFYNNLQ